MLLYYLKAVVYIPILFVELHHISREAVQTTFSSPNSKILHDCNTFKHMPFHVLQGCISPLCITQSNTR